MDGQAVEWTFNDFHQIIPLDLPTVSGFWFSLQSMQSFRTPTSVLPFCLHMALACKKDAILPPYVLMCLLNYWLLKCTCDFIAQICIRYVIFLCSRLCKIPCMCKYVHLSIQIVCSYLCVCQLRNTTNVAWSQDQYPKGKNYRGQRGLKNVILPILNINKARLAYSQPRQSPVCSKYRELCLNWWPSVHLPLWETLQGRHSKPHHYDLTFTCHHKRRQRSVINKAVPAQ